MKTFSITDIGILRTMNQDYFFASETAVGNMPNLFIVSDGMGGHKAGDYASRYTVERVVASVLRSDKENPVEVIETAIEKANEILVKEAENDESKRGMGTTLVVAVVKGSKMSVANVGDSRLYVIGNEIEQITRDHSYVAEMFRQGKVTAEEVREHPQKHMITRAVGAAETIEPDFFEVELKKDDIVLMCTDGLTNMVQDEEICKIIKESPSLEEAAKELVNLANKNGGTDNITIVLVKPEIDEVKKC